MKITALVILAPGFEEIEAITPIDVLRRASVEVTVAGLISGPITASRMTRHLADVDIDTVKDQVFDMVILPGGADGTKNLKSDSRVGEILRKHQAAGKWLAAICAAPTALLAHGVLGKETVVCHPAAQSEIPSAQLDISARVKQDGRIITSLAAGSSMEFAYRLVEVLCSKESVAAVQKGVLAKSEV